MAQVSIHPALNRLLAGFDMVTNGVRVMLNAAGPADIEHLRQETAAAFEERAKFEAAVARFMHRLEYAPPNVELGSPEHQQYVQDLSTIYSRLPTTAKT